MSSRRVTLSDHLALAAKPADKEYQIHDRLLAGLMLRVQPSGAKSWVFRRRVNGRPKRITLGPAQIMQVAEARAKAHAYLAADTTFEPSLKPKGANLRRDGQDLYGAPCHSIEAVHALHP